MIFSIAALLVLLPPSFVVPAPTGELRDSDRRRGVVLSLLLQAEQIEAFRAREQALPRSLADVEVRLPGVRYVRSSNRLFQLIAYTEDGVAVVYDSSAPSPEFESAAPAWRPGP